MVREAQVAAELGLYNQNVSHKEYLAMAEMFGSHSKSADTMLVGRSHRRTRLIVP